MMMRSELSRRDFLQAGALGAATVALPSMLGAAAHPPRDVRCIFLMLVGGPSQLDTFDLKPDAPAEVRGPFRPIQTSVPGVHICEHLPLMAQRAERFSIVRSLHHQAAPIHETGQQLMQTGRLCRLDDEQPHFGAVVAHLRGPARSDAPPFVILPGPIGNTGISISHGQGAGYLGAQHEPVLAGSLVSGREPEALRARYGRHPFGQSCLQARQLIEQGVRFVTVNMFETVFGHVTWDCHAAEGGLTSTLRDYQRTLCPLFDRAFTALLDDLHERGLLDMTLVVATGEFGRTPYLNNRGGRDHHPGVWSMLFAGGGVRGGQVIGASDRFGGEPSDRPVTPAEAAATIYRALGIDSGTHLPGPEGRLLPLCDAAPVAELFG